MMVMFDLLPETKFQCALAEHLFRFGGAVDTVTHHQLEKERRKSFAYVNVQ